MNKQESKGSVQNDELIKLVDMYKRMNQANRYFMVSASGLLLASQCNAEVSAMDGSNLQEAASAAVM